MNDQTAIKEIFQQLDIDIIKKFIIQAEEDIRTTYNSIEKKCII